MNIYGKQGEAAFFFFDTLKCSHPALGMSARAFVFNFSIKLQHRGTQLFNNTMLYRERGSYLLRVKILERQNP